MMPAATISDDQDQLDHRDAAERHLIARARAQRVHDVTVALSNAASGEDVARILLREVVAAIGAEAAVAYAVRGGELVLLGSTGLSQHILSELGVLALDSPLPLAVAAQARQPMWTETFEELITRYPALKESRTPPRLLQAAVALPLLAHEGELIGAAAFSFSSPQRFDDDTRNYVSTLVAHAAMALDRARLRADEAAARARLQLLADASKHFAETTLDLSRALEVIARDVAIHVGDCCAVNLVSADGLRLEHAASHATDPEKAESMRRALADAPVRLDDAGSLLARVVVTGEAVFQPIVPREQLFATARAEHRAHLERFPVASLLIVPLRTRQGIIGTITAARGAPGAPFTMEDRALLVDLSARAALVIANAQQHEDLLRERQRLDVLARASELLASSLDYEATLKNVIALAMPELADFGFFDVVEENGVRRVALAHADDRRQRILSATQWARSERRDKVLCALSAGDTGFHPDIDDAWLQDISLAPEHLALMRDLEFRSMITVPLSYESRLIGALTLFFAATSRKHTSDDVRLAQELARRAASAVENARLFKALQEAVAVRDDFLSIAGHELKTPLTALILQLEAVNRKNVDGPFRERLSKTMRYTARLHSLVNDLLDVSRIRAGRLSVERRDMDLVAVVQQTVERMGEQAKLARCAVTVTVTVAGEAAVTGQWDPDRIEQVVSNLLGNSIKYGAGEPIEIVVKREGTFAVLEVRDHGAGISAKDEQRIFGRFERGEAQRNYGGLGLGLWIVRQVVEAHGGSIRFERPSGKGSRFVVLLPIDADGPSGSPA